MSVQSYYAVVLFCCTQEQRTVAYSLLTRRVIALRGGVRAGIKDKSYGEGRRVKDKGKRVKKEDEEGG